MAKKITQNETVKYFGKYKAPLVEMPSLIDDQIRSYKELLENGIGEIFKEFSPLKDYSGKKFELSFTGYSIGEPAHTEEYVKQNKLTYEVALKVRVRLDNKTTGSQKEQEVFMSDIPMMTNHGTFIINGVERVIVPQLARSYGVFFNKQDIKGADYFGAQIIPARGIWIEIEGDPDKTLYVRIDKKRKFHITTLLRVLGLHTDEQIRGAFAGTPYEKDIEGCLAKDPVKNIADAYVDMYKRLRDGDTTTADNAKEFIDALFTKERYDLSPIGRFRTNSRFGRPTEKKDLEERTISHYDLVSVIQQIFSYTANPHQSIDDIDHLGSRRLRYVGEMFQSKIRVGMAQIKRNIQDRMSVVETDTELPMYILNQRPLQARIKEFFSVNQLSQLLETENVLSEIEHLRLVSALGTGGLTRERASIEVRDVHPSHYGRLCPIHTPEGQNIGLILHLSTYARVNEFGILETPYAKVKNGIITKEIVYLNALEEEKATIAHAGVQYDEKGKFILDRVEARVKGEPGVALKEDITHIDIALNQPFSIATSMIPFLEHNDANRALMGSNMQKQAVPLIVKEAPFVATGMEVPAALYSGRVIRALEDGVVTYMDGQKIQVKEKNGQNRTYDLINFFRHNKSSVYHQKPIVAVGQEIVRGEVLADNSSTVGGAAALGQNVRIAFMPWNGANYEDAIILSERLIRNSKFTSIYVDEFECVVRDTKLGPESTTRDIPNISESRMKDLDENGIVRLGAEVREGDILVGKITPKGEANLTPEEKLLRSIFAEKARDVKDSSLRVDHGVRGRVINIKIFSRELGHQMDSGIIKKVVIQVAQLRNIQVGDKLAGRHGNKGVISTILKEEDMPYMEDGTPVDMILTPLGVPSRMNLGQIYEIHLGLAAEMLGYQAIVPPFAGATETEVKAELVRAGLPEDGRFRLFDGRTGEEFAQRISVGNMYILKLHHMVADKIHARSVGSYSLITQQPLGGRAQGGGQRFGEMEVWALEGYGAAYTLREMLTYKSDDIVGRSSVYDSIIRSKPIRQPNAPASFTVMLNYLRGLGLNVDLEKLKNEEVDMEDIENDTYTQ
jgi:DNA-directed RNA polymerase subunit beta